MQWRDMRREDLAAVARAAEIIHPSFPEDESVFTERLALYPEGCKVLEDSKGCAGYLLSHPWIFGHPPALNSHLKELPRQATSYYLHDLALLPRVRGSGAAGRIVRSMIDHAHRAGFSTLTLIAVNGSAPFWESRGFRIVADEAANLKLASYGEDARFMAYML